MGYVMKTMLISGATFAAALIAQRNGRLVDEEFLAAKEESFQALIAKYPRHVSSISHKYVDPPNDPLDKIEVEIIASGIRRVFPPLDHLVERRLVAITSIVVESIRTYAEASQNIKRLLGEWMQRSEIVRIIGAGRALLAASLPANRLAHGGATISILNDSSPLPNSKLGGGIIAVSASGKTEIVLQIMRMAHAVNKERSTLGLDPIRIVGFSSVAATEFASLCSHGCFLGIRPETYARDVELRALGDIEEYAISELFDALVVVAGLELGINFRMGHEDLVGSATGPWHQH
jgi:hypothetical protein